MPPFRFRPQMLLFALALSCRAGDQPPAAAPAADTSAVAATAAVLTTYQVRPGQEKAFLAAVRKTWDLYRRLDAVQPAPHTLLRRVDEAGHLRFIELFSWRNGQLPAPAPAAIRAAWQDLERLCRQPDGSSGIDAEEVSVLDDSSRPG